MLYYSHTSISKKTLFPRHDSKQTRAMIYARLALMPLPTVLYSNKVFSKPCNVQIQQFVSLLQRNKRLCCKIRPTVLSRNHENVHIRSMTARISGISLLNRVCFFTCFLSQGYQTLTFRYLSPRRVFNKITSVQTPPTCSPASDPRQRTRVSEP